jgi:very-short-patch-repair endonuclease
MHYLSYNKNLKEFSRRLRGNLTDAEKVFWSKIRKKQIKNPSFSGKSLLASLLLIFIVKRRV